MGVSASAARLETRELVELLQAGRLEVETEDGPCEHEDRDQQDEQVASPKPAARAHGRAIREIDAEIERQVPLGRVGHPRPSDLPPRPRHATQAIPAQKAVRSVMAPTVRIS